ncbi:hypothetical protein Tco_1374777 [Tanacetum coccineum]
MDKSHSLSIPIAVRSLDVENYIFRPPKDDEDIIGPEVTMLIFQKNGTSIQINMLVEKKYPLKKAILEKMINLKLEAEEESTMAHKLLKFIKSHIEEQS